MPWKKKNLHPSISYPINIEKFKIIDNFLEFIKINDIYCDSPYCIFNAIDSILYIIYKKGRSIISYNLYQFQTITTIKNIQGKILSIKHCSDKINKRDLIITSKIEETNLEIWDFKNWECIFSIKKVTPYYIIPCFLNVNNNIYIITTNNINTKNNLDSFFQFIYLYDLNGNRLNIINEEENTLNRTYIIDIYYDKKSNKNYIITCNKNDIKSYDYNENKIYHIFYETNNDYHNYFFIYEKNENETLLFESSLTGIIRIWNFHNGLLINKIDSVNDNVYSFCLWDEKYLFVGCIDINHSLKIINLDNPEIIMDIETSSCIFNIKKIIHPDLGECLLTLFNYKWGLGIFPNLQSLFPWINIFNLANKNIFIIIFLILIIILN